MSLCIEDANRVIQSRCGNGATGTTGWATATSQPRQKVPLDSGSCYSVAENRILKLVYRSVERMLRCTTNRFFLQVPAEAFSRSGTRRVNTGPTNRLDSWMQMAIRNVLHFEPAHQLSYDAFLDYSYQAFQGVKVDRKVPKATRIGARARISKYYDSTPGNLQIKPIRWHGITLIPLLRP